MLIKNNKFITSYGKRNNLPNKVNERNEKNIIQSSKTPLKQIKMDIIQQRHPLPFPFLSVKNSTNNWQKIYPKDLQFQNKEFG